jgi:hypothetical protein
VGCLAHVRVEGDLLVLLMVVVGAAVQAETRRSASLAAEMPSKAPLLPFLARYPHAFSVVRQNYHPRQVFLLVFPVASLPVAPLQLRASASTQPPYSPVVILCSRVHALSQRTIQTSALRRALHDGQERLVVVLLLVLLHDAFHGERVVVPRVLV